MTRIIRALAASAILVGVIAGAPVLLVAIGDPTVLLSTDWSTAFLRPDDGTLLLALLGAVGWVAWAVFTFTVAAEIIGVLTEQRLNPTIPGTQWLRPMIGALVAAAFAAPAALTHASAAPAPAPIESPAEEAPAETASPSSEARSRHHVVQPSDELWALAETELGAGDRWREILQLNPHLSPTSHLVPGSLIRLPLDVSVTEGDTLWALAERHLGDSNRWVDIHELNRALIDDPDHLEVGWRIVLPLPEDPPAAPVTTIDEPREATPTPSTPEAAPPTEAPPEAPAASAAAEVETPDADSLEDPDRVDDAAITGVLGPVGGLLAGALFIGISTRRRLQLVARAVGQRLVPLSPNATRFWTALGHRSSTGAATNLAPTSVVLGWDADGDIIHELESTRHLSLDGDAAPASLAAIFTTLIAAPWAAEVEVVLVGDELPWADSLDEPRVSQVEDTPAAVEQLTQLCAKRRVGIGVSSIEELRKHPDRAPSFAPIVFLFSRTLSSKEEANVRAALQMGNVGISVVTLGQSGSTVVSFQDDGATLDGRRFSPQLIEAPARRALVSLFASTLHNETEAAPWWDESMAVRALPVDDDSQAAHPRLQLMGEPELVDAKGIPPTRASGRCIEYCAWLLENPNSTSTFMASQLFVAEGTRRSNMSRLRKWLGSDDDGNEYLPDAYSGRISLDDRVTSDWEEFRSILSGGIVNASERSLRRALTMVKGRLLGRLGDEWPWAMALREDMESLVVDAACELADRSVESAQFEQARWALELANQAAPHHDEVELRLIRVYRSMADQAYAEDAVKQFRSRLRDENRELDDLKLSILHSQPDIQMTSSRL